MNQRLTNAQTAPSVIGTAVPDQLPNLQFEIAALKIISEDCEITRLIGHPAMRRAVADAAGIALTVNPVEPKKRGDVERSRLVGLETQTAGHKIFIGGSGGGKTQAIVACGEDAMSAGKSIVLIDQKPETVTQVIDAARRMGVPASQITLLIPEATGRLPESRPGFNPLQTGIPADQAAADIAGALTSLASTSGVRLEDGLLNGLIVLSVHKLPISRLPALLADETFRNSLLVTPVKLEESRAYHVACEFFRTEFNNWSQSDRTKTSAPIVLRVREILRNPALFDTLCSPEQDIDLSILWRERRILIVNIDRTRLGELGVRLLSTLFTSLLYRTALRCGAGAPRSVILSLDELTGIQKFASGGGGALADILNTARSFKLELLGAVQSLDLVEDTLRTSLLANAPIQLYFRLSHADARHVAAALSAGAGELIERVTVRVAKRERMTGHPERVNIRTPIYDACGRVLSASKAQWQELSWPALLDADGGLAALEVLARQSGTGGLFVRAPDTGQILLLAGYLRGLRGGDWFLTGPTPLSVVVAVPKVAVTRVDRRTESELHQRYIKTLMNLPQRHCLLRQPGVDPMVVRIRDVAQLSGHMPELNRYIAAIPVARAKPVRSSATDPPPPEVNVLDTDSASNAGKDAPRARSTNALEVEDDGSVW